MDDNQELVDVEVPSDNAKGTGKTEAKDQASQKGNAENAKEIDEVTTVDVKVAPEESTEAKKQRNLAAEAGKIAALEKERNEYSRKAAEFERQARGFKEMEKLMKSNPQVYETIRQAYKKQGGEDIGDYENRYGQETQQQTNIPSGTNKSIESLDANSVREIMRDEMDMKAGLTALTNIAPELSADNIGTDEDKRQKALQLFNRVASDATGLKKANPYLSWSEAYKRSYYSQPDIMERMIEKGEISAQAKFLGRQVGTEGSPVGGSSIKAERTVKMTPQEKEVYEKLSASKPKIAQRYIDNLQRR